MAREKDTFTREAHTKAKKLHVPDSGPATAKAEQQACSTGTLHQLVDPKGYGVIRRSLPRFVQRSDGLWELTNGPPMPMETRVDTTGSMGGNVEVAIRVLPDAFELCSGVLPGWDLQMATGIFGDVQDVPSGQPDSVRGRFTLCRPQFEMTAEKIVEQLTLMVPLKQGGDNPEDPQYGLFGGAYLTSAYVSRIGLLGYDFTVSDAPGRNRLDRNFLRCIFGEEVFAMVAENGHNINPSNLPTTTEVVTDLLRRAHAFFLQVGDSRETTRFWEPVFGPDRVVMLPTTELLPHVQAVIIGLTEGTLGLGDVKEFLQRANVCSSDATSITRAVANIPIGAQAAFPNFAKRPKKGDLYKGKTDTWPIDPNEVVAEISGDEQGTPGDGPIWS